MSKEYLEAKPKDIANLLYEVYDVPSGICEQIKNMVERLEAIDNANPSEALNITKATEKYTGIDLSTIKQALLKAQEQEKVIKIIKEKCIGNDNLRIVERAIDYEMYEWAKDDLKPKEQLTQEEFELLKRYCDDKNK